MIPTVTNNIELLTLLLITILCISGVYLSIKLENTKEKLRKENLKYLSEKSAGAILKANANDVATEDLIAAAEYGYNYHKTTRYPLWSFNKNCLNNFLQYLEAKKLKHGV